MTQYCLNSGVQLKEEIFKGAIWGGYTSLPNFFKEYGERRGEAGNGWYNMVVVLMLV